MILRFKTVGVVALCLAVLLFGSLMLSQRSALAQSAPAWQPNTAYAVGALVTFNGATYRCLQPHTSQVGWEPATTPALWSLQSGTPSPTPVPSPTPGPSPTPTPAPTPTPPPSGGCAAVWQATQVYTAGMRASLQGINYEAKWWTQGENPAQKSGPDDVWRRLGSCTPTPSPTPTPTPAPTPTPTPNPNPTPTPNPPPTGGKRVVGYFAEWGVYGRTYFVKNIDTSGSAAKLTHIQYAFGNVSNNQCQIVDSFADYDKFYDAAGSVDGVADTWDPGVLRGSFNQLRKLKAKYPNLKVVISLGGWTLSGGFASAARPENRAAVVKSCIDMFIKGQFAAGLNHPGVFDGIDIDWEYPAACGLQCGGPEDTANFTGLMQEFRRQLDAVRPGLVLSAAVPAGSDKISKIQVSQLAQVVNFVSIMTYDFFGAWAAQGPTAFHSPLFAWTGMPSAPPANDYFADRAVQLWINAGMPASKINLGVPFYGRGWAGVGTTNGGLNQPATNAATGSFEPGSEDYKVLKTKGTATTHPESQTAFVRTSDGQWWSYDTTSSMTGKMSYVKSKGLGGVMFWELSGDTTNGELITAISNGLK